MGRETEIRELPADMPDILPARAQDIANAQDSLAALKTGYGQGRDLVNQLLGQAQAFKAAGNLLQTFGVSKLAIVKENKLYQQLSGVRTPNGLELKGTWAEFCELLGVSDEKANQDIANLKAFGEDALDQMQRIGIGYRELRQYRKLPEDQKQALIEVAKTGDKEGFVELAEEIITRHTREKVDLEREVGELRAEAKANQSILDNKNAKIDKLERLSKRIQAAPPIEGHTQILHELSDLAEKAIGSIQGGVRKGFDALVEHHVSHGGDSRQVMAGYVAQLQQMVNELRDDFNLPDTVGDGTPAWQVWADAQDAAKAADAPTN